MKNVLTIAGSDSGGGAGIQADLKTFSAHGVFGMSVITSITAQNTVGVLDIEDVSSKMVAAQIKAIFEDIPVHAVKIGMVSEISIIETITEELLKYKAKNIIMDPVMVSKSGAHLLKPEATQILINKLLPITTLVTPNILEAEVITGLKIKNYEDMEKAAYQIHSMGIQNVLVKGGHLDGDAADILYDGKSTRMFVTKRIDTKNTHGTGCTLSSAIASNLALGFPLEQAIQKAKEYMFVAIENSFDLGQGVGPVHHFFSLYKKAGMI
ncbi:bifunctional hydroxymethylpyrimidine kinase/phosphomethylpyrimidine kinase [Selenomonadales bacterium OttesenSCG-928-I06]|nr:bifunctional hydroxymethylpyrimidine kinase/phosphomethylpyrimidine kinase [Selenomonadales bacterium OttesenSCG-928-I06]